MHAVNAFLGRPAYTWPTFLDACDEFDKTSGLPAGTSRTLFLSSTDEGSLFKFVIRKAGSVCDTEALSMFRSRHIDAVDQKTPARLQHADTHAVAAFVYNSGHVWTLKKHDGRWFKLDSLSGIQASSLESAWREGLGIELVFPPGNRTETQEERVDDWVQPQHPSQSEPVATVLRARAAMPTAAAMPIPQPLARHTAPIRLRMQMFSGRALRPAFRG